MLLGLTASLHIDSAGKLVQREHDPAKQVVLPARHAFLPRDADFTGVIFPAPQDLDRSSSPQRLHLPVLKESVP